MTDRNVIGGFRGPKRGRPGRGGLRCETLELAGPVYIGRGVLARGVSGWAVPLLRAA